MATLKPVPSSSENAPAFDARRVWTLRLLSITGVLCALFAVVYALKRHVDRTIAWSSGPPRIVLKNRPAWMSDYLAERILATAQPKGRFSAFDQHLLVDVLDGLKSDPDVAAWIRNVRQVRRVYVAEPGDTVEVDCEFRAPVALARWGDSYWFVDAEGVKLPEEFTSDQLTRVIIGADGKMNIRVIEGIQQPPSDPGMVWTGDDVQAGIEMARVLYAQPFAEDVVKIDVTNFGGRDNPREAHLGLVTRYNTRVNWGRAPSAKDAFVEVAPSKKLDSLRTVYERFGRVDARQVWIDVRFDRITYPTAAPGAPTGGPTAAATTSVGVADPVR